MLLTVSAKLRSVSRLHLTDRLENAVFRVSIETQYKRTLG